MKVNLILKTKLIDYSILDEFQVAPFVILMTDLLKINFKPQAFHKRRQK